MKLEALRGKKILIVGYGVEGRAVESFLKYHYPDIVIGIVDQKDGPHYLDKQHEYDLAVKSPGVKKSLITISYTTATNIFFANNQNKIIGVTGTKGKSTTASLIYHILNTSGITSHLVGNIGRPALELLTSPINKNDVIVMELSSYQLDDIYYSPHFIVITSLFPEHMDYHGTVDSYYDAKRNILARVKPDDVVFYNSKYQRINNWLQSVQCEKIDANNQILENVQTQLVGKHNFENVLLAYAVAKKLHIANSKIVDALFSFKPLPHRLEKLGRYGDIVFYDDAISTTPESTIAAITSLENVDTLFLGGKDRGFDFIQLVDCIIQKKVTNLVLFPDSGKKIYSLLKSRNVNGLNILQTSSMREAVAFAFQHTKKGAICLLSTASPSYSLWKNYVEKGNLFKKYILEYEKK